MQGLLLFLILAPLLLTYELVVTYLPSIGTSSGRVSTPEDVILIAGVLVVIAILVLVTTFSADRGIGRFMLAGAFRHSRKVRSLVILQVMPGRTSVLWTLRCQAEGQDLTVVVTARRERLQAALDLAGQSLLSGGSGA